MECLQSMPGGRVDDTSGEEAFVADDIHFGKSGIEGISGGDLICRAIESALYNSISRLKYILLILILGH